MTDYLESLSDIDQQVLREAQAILARVVRENPVLTSYTAVLDYLHVTLRPHRVERLCVLYLDRKNRLVADEVIASGTVDHTPMYPREILRRALQLDASAFIIAHNHPSGDPTPSKSDVDMSKALAKGAKVLGLTLHDSIIIGDRTDTSLRAEGVL